ncbi:MAG: hypothetical protein IT158_25615 [Bryobacterales bacterium]|nr:hypothetical protein [Bryobacterales bacterium]
MKCRDFEGYILDLARDRPMKAADREAALAHAAGCPRCGARLSLERDLTAGLRLMAGAANGGVPERGEAVLLEAFRKSARRRTLALRLWPYWAAAAAAAAVAAVLLSPARTVRQPASPPQQARSMTPAVPVPAPARAGEPEPRQPVRVARKRPGLKPPAPASPAPEAPEPVMTGFLPVTYGAGLRPPEAVSVVRVSLPRSTLIRYGLPVNMERAAEPLQADVVFGEDGMARAIRFIR